MQHQFSIVLILLAAMGLVTLIDITGSISSRKFNFNYGHFAVLSFLVYTGTSYVLYSLTESKPAVLMLLLLLGFYDSTVGWKIAKKYKANYGKFNEMMEKMTVGQAVISGLVFAFVCAWVGIFLAE